jgi:hypothetical protein
VSGTDPLAWSRMPEPIDPEIKRSKLEIDEAPAPAHPIRDHAATFGHGALVPVFMVAGSIATNPGQFGARQLALILLFLGAALVVPTAFFALGLWLQRRYTGLPRRDSRPASFMFGFLHAAGWLIAFALSSTNARTVSLVIVAALAPMAYSFVAVWLFSPFAKRKRT